MTKEQREKIWFILHEMHVKHDADQGVRMIEEIISDIEDDAFQRGQDSMHPL